LYEKAVSLNGKPSSVCELGDQCFFFGITHTGLPIMFAKHWFELEHISHLSIDIHGKNGSLAFDLRTPLPDGFPTFDMVTNFGVAEHVSDQDMAWANILKLCRWGGVMVHEGPGQANFPVHQGLPWYEPHFFKDLAEKQECILLHNEHVTIKDGPCPGVVAQAIIRKSRPERPASKIQFSIITPVFRTQNVETLRKTIFTPESDYFDVTWHVTFDGNFVKTDDPVVLACATAPHTTVSWYHGPTPQANVRQNVAIELIADGWVYCLDDDTILHPNFWSLMRRYLPKEPGVLVGHQAIKGGQYRLTSYPQHMQPCQVDMGSFAFHRRLMGDYRWVVDGFADGWFAKWLYEHYPDKFVFANEPISYYNYLR
jgi:hypothetical protein